MTAKEKIMELHSKNMFMVNEVVKLAEDLEQQLTAAKEELAAEREGREQSEAQCRAIQKEKDDLQLSFNLFHASVKYLLSPGILDRKGWIEGIADINDVSKKYREDVLNRLHRMEETLGWYADPSTYEATIPQPLEDEEGELLGLVGVYVAPIGLDKGANARDVLEGKLVPQSKIDTLRKIIIEACGFLETHRVFLNRVVNCDPLIAHLRSGIAGGKDAKND